MRIAVAMSGGVDSSVAALMLLEQGHDVFGLTMRLWSCGDDEEGPKVCCGPESVRSAARVASTLGITHHALSMHRSFEDAVVSHFVAEYGAGRTPNPCVRCNELMKFEELLARARGLGADALATGHHARVRRGASGAPELWRALDADKDQTYFLYRVTREQLDHVLFPVGELQKDDVRARAREAGLAVADRAESQDVCFVPGGDLETFLRERAPHAVRPGAIVDREGTVIGEHRGFGLYTVGQRKGLALSRPRPAYVLAVNPEANTVVVGDDEDLLSQSLEAHDAHWIPGEAPGTEFRADAKVRSTAAAAPCSVRVDGDRVAVLFDAPQRALAPGQSVVLYRGDAVLGGATIARGSIAGSA
ncbi:MAG: tRNA 2-thiouridine(34) synthase MnmA [Candidatus Eisenbacteria bacterium]